MSEQTLSQRIRLNRWLNGFGSPGAVRLRMECLCAEGYAERVARSQMDEAERRDRQMRRLETTIWSFAIATVISVTAVAILALKIWGVL